MDKEKLKQAIRNTKPKTYSELEIIEIIEKVKKNNSYISNVIRFKGKNQPRICDIVEISYIPDKDDGIFDKILYVKLNSTEVVD